MAKFDMKDYENFMKEEERQNRLQEELEIKHIEEDREADAIWRDWQAEQEAQKYEDQYYQDDDCYCPECEDDYYDPSYLLDAYDPFGDLLDAGVPYESESYRPTAEDLNDMYAYSLEEEYCCLEDEYLDPFEEELSLGISEFDEDAVEKELICRKATSRNRHHASEKAKKRAEKAAEILESKFWKLYSDVTNHKEANYWRLHSEQPERDAFVESEYIIPRKIRRLYYAEKAATKKVNRVKVKNA